MRTFIAIDLDQEIKDVLFRFIESLKRGGGQIRWVSKDAMHLTLKFLGEIGQEDKQKIEGILEAVVGNYGSFSLRLRGTGYFPPNRKDPRVIWAGTEEIPSLMALQANLEKELDKTEFPKEKRDYHPHLTLGRVRDPHRIQDTLALLEKEKETIFGEMSVKKITFFQSTLRPTGAEYTVLSEHNLK